MRSGWLRRGELARKGGFKPKIVDFADLDIADLPKQAALW